MMASVETWNRVEAACRANRAALGTAKPCGCRDNENCDACFTHECPREGYESDGARFYADGSAYMEWQRCGADLCEHGVCTSCGPACGRCEAIGVRRAKQRREWRPPPVAVADPESDIAF